MSASRRRRLSADAPGSIAMSNNFLDCEMLAVAVEEGRSDAAEYMRRVRQTCDLSIANAAENAVTLRDAQIEAAGQYELLLIAEAERDTERVLSQFWFGQAWVETIRRCDAEDDLATVTDLAIRTLSLLSRLTDKEWLYPEDRAEIQRLKWEMGQF